MANVTANSKSHPIVSILLLFVASQVFADEKGLQTVKLGKESRENNLGKVGRDER